MVRLAEDAERAAFEALIERNLARLRAHARPYISRLSLADKEYLILKAFDYAWNRREQLRSQTRLLLWWEDCLRSAAMTRENWRQRHMDRWEWVTNRQLGSENF